MYPDFSNSYEYNASLQRLKDSNSSGYGSLNQFRDNDFTNSVSVRGVSHSVTNRARAGPVQQRFMSLEEECNWILSGREPIFDGDDFDEDDDEDNTLDDISGDEVSCHNWFNFSLRLAQSPAST